MENIQCRNDNKQPAPHLWSPVIGSLSAWTSLPMALARQRLLIFAMLMVQPGQTVVFYQCVSTQRKNVSSFNSTTIPNLKTRIQGTCTVKGELFFFYFLINLYRNSQWAISHHPLAVSHVMQLTNVPSPVINVHYHTVNCSLLLIQACCQQQVPRSTLSQEHSQTNVLHLI